MATDFTNSAKERQNVLNNKYALAHAENHLSLGGVSYGGETVFTKQQLMELFGVSEATIERYITGHAEELKANGYRLIKGKNLKDFKQLAYGTLISEGTKTSVLGVFSFRSLLNLAMLLTESEQARNIRSRLLDIVIDVMAERSGGHTKFINQRDQDYLPAAFQEYSHREEFTRALSSYLDMGPMKFGIYTNKIYQAIFHENATEYKKILNLAEKDNMRETLYAEVIRAIASFESGLATEMKNFHEKNGRTLRPVELDNLIKAAEDNPYMKPILNEARTKMASRDLCFRDALHEKLESYIQAVPEGDFVRFLGETSKSLEERLADPELLAVFKRLKDR